MADEYPIYADLGYNIAVAQADDAWRRFVAQAGLSAEQAEAEKERARKLLRAREAQDIERYKFGMAGRGLYFSGLAAKGMGRIQAQYMNAWADLLNEIANRYTTMAQQGWATNADIAGMITSAALDYLQRIQSIYVPGS
jgi:hypothetical protein